MLDLGFRFFRFVGLGVEDFASMLRVRPKGHNASVGLQPRA